VGHCSDTHGFCAALGRALNYPTRVVYGHHPYPKNSPSHLQTRGVPAGVRWVPFDVSETQLLLQAHRRGAASSTRRAKEKLSKAAKERC